MAVILFGHLPVLAQLSALKEKVSINQNQTTALKIIELLDKQSSYSFTYAQEQLSAVTIPSFKAEGLGEALTLLQKQYGLQFAIRDGNISIKPGPKPENSPASAPQKKPGRVTGKIIDQENGQPVPDATIRIGNKGTISAIDGSFNLSLPTGKYNAEISSLSYGRKRITDVEVKDDAVFELNVTLKREKGQLATVVITSSAKKESIASLYSRQKNNAAVSDGISAEQIRVTPDNNVAQVLKRVSGITIQNEKFVTIRGVSDRYNNVLINGASLPSTEPNRRNFSFDIVPSALLDNIVVNKSATPDLPGEFTGGLAQINTRDVPQENFLSIAIGTGFNTASAGRDFLGYRRDKNAALGIVDPERKWFGDGRVFDPPKYLAQAIYGGDVAYRQKVGAAIPNHWQKYKYPYSPMQNYQLAGGINKSLKHENSIGAIAAVTYRNEMAYEEGDSRVLQQTDFESKRFKYNTAIGALLNAGFKSKRHRLSWKNIYNYKYSNQFDEMFGAYIGQQQYAKRTSDVTLTNSLLHTRLEGEHSISKIGIKLDWYGDYIRQVREQPDSRFLTGLTGRSASYIDEVFIDDDNRYGYSFNNPSITQNGLYGSQLKEIRKNAAGNLSLPFIIGGAKQLFKTGYLWSDRDADFDGTGIAIVAHGDYVRTTGGLPYYQVVTQDAFRNGNLSFLTAYARSGTTGDRYTGKQKLRAWYGMLDLRLLKKLRLTGGVRREDNEMILSTVFYNTQGMSEFRDTVYKENDWLPSANLIYSLTDKFNIRAAYSKTMARPDFVERSPYIYFDFAQMVEVIGENNLKTSRIKNYDLRFEYYPSSTEILSASVFYKDFDQPVEMFYFIGSVSNAMVYRNLHSATARGFEFDIRKSMSFISRGSSWLQNLYFSANATFLKGGIKYIITKSPFTSRDTSFFANGNRPIQGLSPYIINSSLNYQSKSWGLNISYNRYGRRIVNGGIDPILVQYENPRDVVDLQLSTRLMKQKAEIKFNVADLLNQYFIIYSNNINYEQAAGRYIFPPQKPNNDPKGDAFNEAMDLVNYKVKKGTNFSIVFTYKL
ncbi:TonB-dependent receptor domain-containing protein [Chitinophaga sp. SYP-B3965]|uniref:TonB-dependent receptor domain-containing protein n=1 Tax=Chitinophaga sp. SYP-B3965 TaxID=2663120 RepID=UPI001566E647|nr:TonB-dependent receptor [Chitinophaga sp. SYP-B3965]